VPGTKGAGELDAAQAYGLGRAGGAAPDITLKLVIDNAVGEGKLRWFHGTAVRGARCWPSGVVFLRNWRAIYGSGRVAAVGDPCLSGMKYFGYTLNTVTLLSLALVVSRLVDDAIVEIETLSATCAWATVRRGYGKQPMRSAWR
jgi:hypothetical protein